jgi:ATP-dependent exoDNAse (exonuclease V) beta subunit
VQRIYERRKSEAGVLDYVDLLLKAAEALRSNASLRTYFRRKFRAIIVDEYQDTDPLQVEIIETLAGLSHGGEEDKDLGTSSYVVVGDPKQSIYRFRRADASIFAAACEAAATRPGMELVSLTQNFRSTPAILRFVNRYFSNTIKKSQYGQPDYEPLVASPHIADEPSLLALKFAVPVEADSSVLEAEASAIAGFVAAAVQTGTFKVREGGESRPSRAGDVLILARRLTQIRPLEQALERAGVPFVVDGGRSFFLRSEVVETHAVLRAVDDPSDATSLVAALRSSFFGVSDREIAEWRFAGRELSILGLSPGGPTRKPRRCEPRPSICCDVSTRTAHAFRPPLSSRGSSTRPPSSPLCTRQNAAPRPGPSLASPTCAKSRTWPARPKPWACSPCAGSISFSPTGSMARARNQICPRRVPGIRTPFAS